MNEHLGPLDEFVNESKGLVHHVAKRFSNTAKANGLDYEDIVQEGFIGLIKAYNRFDPTHGCAFSSFAVPHIWGAISLSLRDYGPFQAYRKEKEIARQIYRADLDDHSAAEVAEKLGCTEKQATHAIRFRQTTVLSTDYPISMGRETVELNDMLPDHDDQTGVMVDEFLSKLNAKQAIAARLRLLGGTQKEIARAMDKSQAQVCRYMVQIGKRYLEEVDNHVEARAAVC